jgi:hypothetical protein
MEAMGMKRRIWRAAGMLAAGMLGTAVCGAAAEMAEAHAAAQRTDAPYRETAGMATADIRSRMTMPAPGDSIASLRLDLSRAGSLPALLQRSALVVRAHPGSGAPAAHATGRTVTGGAKIVNYVQQLHTLETLKGTAPAGLRIVLPGIDPLPPATDPLNETYPGPLAGDVAFVLFLQPTGLAGLYTTVGGWQGIYPIGDDGRTIALAGAGFPQLGGLTPPELRARLHAAAAHP